jgi:hypothetical protein
MIRASKNWLPRTWRGDLGRLLTRQRRGLRRLVVGFGRGRGPGLGPGPGRPMGGENATISGIMAAISIYSGPNVKRLFGG